MPESGVEDPLGPGPAGDESYVILEQKKDFGADFGRFPAKNDVFLAVFEVKKRRF